MSTRNWLHDHRGSRPYAWQPPGEEGDMFGPHDDIIFSRHNAPDPMPALLADEGFNNHDVNGGKHVSPYDEGRVDVGVDNLEVRLVQGVDEEQLRKTLRRAIRATNGVDPSMPDEDTDPEEMLKGGLQTALETQVIVFEVIGASRVLTHQLVRSRRASFHQQSQRATFYGDRPNARWPASVFENEDPALNKSYVQMLWEQAQRAAWTAYSAACDAGISYQDARYILPEGTTNYILCEYSIREFIAMFAYRGCSMFQWEMVQCVREMRRVLLEAHPFLDPYVKISCEKGQDCSTCKGTGEYSGRLNMHLPPQPCPACKGIGSNRKCTFQGWENVEGVCDFPWAKQSNRVFLPDPRNRIGAGAAPRLQPGYVWCSECTTDIGERFGPADCAGCRGTGQLPDLFPALTARPMRCPTCDSRSPASHPAVSGGGEVTRLCPDPWHGA